MREKRRVAPKLDIHNHYSRRLSFCRTLQGVGSEIRNLKARPQAYLAWVCLALRLLSGVRMRALLQSRLGNLLTTLALNMGELWYSSHSSDAN